MEWRWKTKETENGKVSKSKWNLMTNVSQASKPAKPQTC